MIIRRLKWLAIVLPLVYWSLVLYLRSILFSEQLSVEGDFFALLMIALGSVFFTLGLFRIIDHRETEVLRRTNQLKALHTAALSLTTELELGAVLQKVTDLSRNLANAKYGALSVFDEEGKQLEQFIVSGMPPQRRVQIPELPKGRGLLGVPLKEGRSIRVRNIGRDPRSVGFPSNHPVMHSLLAVPIVSKGNVIGNLYLTDKLSADGNGGQASTAFSRQDQEILEMFATQAAIAIENAQLYRQNEQLAILQERERFGMDLHDGIIQSIYAIGLMLEDGQHRLKTEPETVNGQITQAIHGLNEVIRDIRNYILDLRPQRFQGRDLRRGLEELTRDLRANSFLNVNLEMNSVDSDTVHPEQAVEILHIVQEALTNARKHARATRVDVHLHQQEEGSLLVVVEDNGIGFVPQATNAYTGNGLRNMRERTNALNGDIQFELAGASGTRVRLSVPLGEHEKVMA